MNAELPQHEPDEENFLNVLADTIEESAEPEEETEELPPNSNSDTTFQYNRRKPKWWRQLSGKATKAQRHAQAAMTAYRLDKPPYGSYFDWTSIFGCEDVWFEIGFGSGDNLLCLAQRHPQRAFIGAEIHGAGKGRLFQHMQGAIERQQAWTGYRLFDDPQSDDEWGPPLEHGLDNLRVYGGDGVMLFRFIRPASLSAILVTFPDPFSSAGSEEWRLMQTHTVADMAKVLCDNGRLYLATDHAGYFEWSVGIVDDYNAQSRRRLQRVEPCPPRSEWLPVISRYEQKGWDEGRSTMLVCWQVVDE